MSVNDSNRIDALEKDMYKGNGKPGLKSRVDITEVNICKLTEQVSNLATNVSALLRFQTQDETKHKLLEQQRKERRNLYYFLIAQSIALTGVVIIIFVK